MQFGFRVPGSGEGGALWIYEFWGLGLRVWVQSLGFGFRVLGLGVKGVGFRFKGLRMWGLGPMDKWLGFRV